MKDSLTKNEGKKYNTHMEIIQMVGVKDMNQQVAHSQ